MNDKILKAIEESLPQMQVAAIRKALEELEELRVSNKSLTEDVAKYKKYYLEMGDSVNKLQAENVTLMAEKEALILKNIKLTELDMENKVTVAMAKLEGVNNTVDKFLGNTIYRETLQHQVVDEGTSIQNQYTPDGRYHPIPTPYKTNKPVTDVKTTGTASDVVDETPKKE